MKAEENDSLKRENDRIARIANEYRQKGYMVTVNPSLDELPKFLGNYKPDIVVKNQNESVIIEVKSHANLNKTSELSRIAEIINDHHGWRFELIMTNPRGTNVFSPNSKLPNEKEIAQRLLTSKKLAGEGYLEAALVTAWSALEGLLRVLGKEENISLDRKSSTQMIKQFYSLGLIDYNTYKEIYKLNNIRDSVVHGLVEPNLHSSTISRFVETVQKIVERYKHDKENHPR